MKTLLTIEEAEGDEERCMSYLGGVIQCVRLAGHNGSHHGRDSATEIRSWGGFPIRQGATITAGGTVTVPTITVSYDASGDFSH